MGNKINCYSCQQKPQHSEDPNNDADEIDLANKNLSLFNLKVNALLLTTPAFNGFIENENNFRGSLKAWRDSDKLTASYIRSNSEGFAINEDGFDDLEWEDDMKWCAGTYTGTVKKVGKTKLRHGFGRYVGASGLIYEG